MQTLVDSHCHLNFEPLGDEVEQVLARAKEQGIGHFLCVSVDLENYPQVLAIAQKYPQVFASVGVHPNHTDAKDPSAEELTALAQDKDVVAIGETGLDYYRSEGDLGWQHERFRQHIRAARESGKPLIIHTRNATTDTIKIMKEEGANRIGGVMHCFAEDWAMAKAALDLDFYISFSGIITFKSAESLREVARKVPVDRMLVETDCPYLAPVPHRGKTNEPAYVSHVAQCLAKARGDSVEEVTENTTANFFRLFSTAVS